MRFTQLFGRTLRERRSDIESASHDLLERACYVRQHAAGIYVYLTLGLRSLRRIEGIIRDEMAAAGAQEILMSVVQDADVWRRTGRYDTIDETLVRFKDRRGHDCVLGMTHEEIVASLAATELRSYRDLDVVVYQIQTKFRDEARSRGGLLRTREFLMKDAYSLHLTVEGLAAAYANQAAAYHRIFHRVGLHDVAMVESSTGLMGGLRAHEFMCFLDVGEDTVAVCEQCGFAANREVTGERRICDRCGGTLAWHRGVEVGNIFQLGTRYTDAMGVAVTDAAGNQSSVIMGSYGIGVSRLLACLVEQFHDDRGIALTAATAALDVHLVVLGKDRATLSDSASVVERQAVASGLDLLWDDRDWVSAGEQLADADLMGATMRMTIGRSTQQNGTVELRERRSGQVHVVALEDSLEAALRLRQDIIRREGVG
ncbi:MAG TPA: aminoacyl--tRNA ligase-related protein [Gemmatimonadaceae bacterium]|nr:aminoacyl--tRNA ligase-related protein [Gemmatimonadaceae bacterium]